MIECLKVTPKKYEDTIDPTYYKYIIEKLIQLNHIQSKLLYSINILSNFI